MKKFLMYISIAACIAGSLVMTTVSAKAVPIESKAQFKAQISFFNDVLDSVGPTNPDQAVSLWATGDKTRNGVYKYAVAGEKLRLQLIEQWGDPEKNFWIIGASSPWLAGYNVDSKIMTSPTEIEYVVKYFWQTSTGPGPTTGEKLYIVKDGANWFVDKVQ